ncbi:MAG: hypothetical protein WD208_10105 [Dehalococcoidia bacterium]
MTLDQRCPKCNQPGVQTGYGLFGLYARCDSCSWLDDLDEVEVEDAVTSEEQDTRSMESSRN